VPFGEYVPLRNYLWFLKPIAELIGDFTPGTSSAPLRAEKIRAGVLICFESVFPEIARRETAEGANLLVTLTNDAWYGRSSAPVHSWAMTVLRAVENRRSMVRAANTGISGFVGPSGDILGESPLFVANTLTDSVPLMTEQTVFVQGGHWFGTVCLAMIPPLFFFFAIRSRRPRKPSLRSLQQ
jgi:apolipoprotein N-acyltransferase